MADKVTRTDEMKLEFSFYDGDTRTLALDNPRSDITVAEILAVGATAKTTQAIIGDKGGAAVVGISAAKTVSKKVTNLDLK